VASILETPPALEVADVSRPGDVFVPARDGLPEYTVRVSDRARHIRLTSSAHEGLVVVVPRRLRRQDVRPLVQARLDWIARTSHKFAERRALFAAGADALLPDAVAFRATGEEWHVEYRQSAAADPAAPATPRAGSRPRRRTRTSARLVEGALVVTGDIDDAQACLAALQRWLQRAARERLLAMLAEESQRARIDYKDAIVRGQRSRWGSCSHAGTISLNRGLVFLPPELARSVIVHELAHRRHPDHSAAFWRHLEDLDPLARRHRSALRGSWDLVPAWAEARL
jgi:predicted metal-dependent hydrolase